jgi:hypothetical protein
MGTRGLRKDDSAAIRLGAAGRTHEQDADSGAALIRPQLISICPGEARDSDAARPGEYYASWNKDVRAAFLLVYVGLPYTLFYSAQFAIKIENISMLFPLTFDILGS